MLRLVYLKWLSTLDDLPLHWDHGARFRTRRLAPKEAAAAWGFGWNLPFDSQDVRVRARHCCVPDAVSRSMQQMQLVGPIEVFASGIAAIH